MHEEMSLRRPAEPAPARHPHPCALHQAHLSAHMVEEEALVLPRLAAAFSRDALALHGKRCWDGAGVPPPPQQQQQPRPTGPSPLRSSLIALPARSHTQPLLAGKNFEAAKLGASFLPATLTRMHKEAPGAATGAAGTEAVPMSGATVTTGVPGEEAGAHKAAPARIDSAGEEAPMATS